LLPVASPQQSGLEIAKITTRRSMLPKISFIAALSFVADIGMPPIIGAEKYYF
jgi:hypothetical protein